MSNRVCVGCALSCCCSLLHTHGRQVQELVENLRRRQLDRPALVVGEPAELRGGQREHTRGRGDEDPGRAEPTLQAMLLFERRLDRMQLACGQRLDKVIADAILTDEALSMSPGRDSARGECARSTPGPAR